MQILFSDYGWGAGTATDLVNTSPRVRSAGEALPDPEALSRFLTEHQVPAPADRTGSAPSTADVLAVHTLRDELRAMLEYDSETEMAAAANALLSRSTLGARLARDEAGSWQWYVHTAPDAAPQVRLAALSAVGVLGTLRTLGAARFRGCAAPDCDGAFIDTSRAGRRRYCMPELCGNRRNVANHRARGNRRGGP
ncbi:CGNR zinc finger domain-containing protein [Streptomyces sp. CA-250714]|uniref:CGNR zinc finger domain-containing protein n=1 Tax=Streptomyces sp. CA-250714 TaxID=3240060 RepID=UPI003D9056A8